MNEPKKTILFACKWFSYALIFCLILLGGGYLTVQYNGNMHIVDENMVYRSAQLDKVALRNVIVTNGIKSILNLRGDNSGRVWYDNEIEVASLLGVEHLDHRLSSSKRVPLQEMKQLLEQIEQAPKPILIHCRDGADRTGLVSALYLAKHGKSIDQAKGQLSFIYGHIPVLIHSDKIAMDESLDDYLTQTK